MKKHKKIAVIICMVLLLTFMFSTTAFADGTGDVAGAIESTWKDASSQIKTVVNKVVFPAIDLILAVFFLQNLEWHTLIIASMDNLNGQLLQFCLRVLCLP